MVPELARSTDAYHPAWAHRETGSPLQRSGKMLPPVAIFAHGPAGHRPRSRVGTARPTPADLQGATRMADAHRP